MEVFGIRRAAVLAGVLLVSSVLGGCIGNFSRIPRPAHTDRVGMAEPGAPNAAPGSRAL